MHNGASFIFFFFHAPLARGIVRGCHANSNNAKIRELFRPCTCALLQCPHRPLSRCASSLFSSKLPHRLWLAGGVFLFSGSAGCVPQKHWNSCCYIKENWRRCPAGAQPADEAAPEVTARAEIPSFTLDRQILESNRAVASEPTAEV